MNIEYISNLPDPSSFLGRKRRDLIDGRSLRQPMEDIRGKALAFEPELFLCGGRVFDHKFNSESSAFKEFFGI